MKEHVPTSLRIPADLYAKITAAATERVVSRNWLIVRLLAESIDHLIPVDEITLTRRTEGGDRG